MTSVQTKAEKLIESQSKLITDFTTATQGLVQAVQADREKINFVYDFLFIGKPEANPPVPPFVVSMQRNTEDIDDFKKVAGRLLWAMVGLILTGISLFTVAVYNHVYLGIGAK
jgi:hypothetical protein